MQRWNWKLGPYLNFIVFINIGRRIKHDSKVLNKLINNKIPIDDVPSWFDIDRVLNEHKVVKPLNKIADGVFEV